MKKIIAVFLLAFFVCGSAYAAEKQPWHKRILKKSAPAPAAKPAPSSTVPTQEVLDMKSAAQKSAQSAEDGEEDQLEDVEDLRPEDLKDETPVGASRGEPLSDDLPPAPPAPGSVKSMPAAAPAAPAVAPYAPASGVPSQPARGPSAGPADLPTAPSQGPAEPPAPPRAPRRND